SIVDTCILLLASASPLMFTLSLHDALPICLLELVGGPLGQGVGAAVDVAVVLAIVIHDRLDHRLGLLGGGCVIQVDQRLAVHFLLQDRKILADLLGVESGAALGGQVTHNASAPAHRPGGSRQTAWSGVAAGSPGWPAPAPGRSAR